MILSPTFFCLNQGLENKNPGYEYLQPQEMKQVTNKAEKASCTCPTSEYIVGNVVLLLTDTEQLSSHAYKHKQQN